MTGPEPGPTHAVQVRVPGDDADLVSGLLWAAGVSAVGEQTDGSDVVLTSDVPPGGADAVAAVLGDRWPVRVVEVADDGLDAWRAHATATRAGRHLVVRPPWVTYAADPDDVVLAIDPGRAFGHGAHPTSRSCLAVLEDLVHPDCTVLDVGCGSGVLAVAAARLGAAAVTAVDVDPEAVRATAANARANGVDDQVSVSGAALQDVPGQFQLVVANIGAATLIDLAEPLVQRVASGGSLVLSGLLSDRWQDTAQRFEQGALAVRRVVHDDGWATVLLRLGSG